MQLKHVTREQVNGCDRCFRLANNFRAQMLIAIKQDNERQAGQPVESLLSYVEKVHLESWLTEFPHDEAIPIPFVPAEGSERLEQDAPAVEEA